MCGREPASRAWLTRRLPRKPNFWKFCKRVLTNDPQKFYHEQEQAIAEPRIVKVRESMCITGTYYCLRQTDIFLAIDSFLLSPFEEMPSICLVLFSQFRLLILLMPQSPIFQSTFVSLPPHSLQYFRSVPCRQSLLSLPRPREP